MTEPISPPPIDTTKMARDMTPAEQEAFFRHCKKLEGGSLQSKPVDTTKMARDMTPAQREEWWANHARQWR
jgi:hypothetical protein